MNLDKTVIDRVLSEQKDELAARRKRKWVSRREEERIHLSSPLAQVVIGVRRSGKSTLCFNTLEKARVKYGYVNFDDENFMNLEASMLNDVLEGVYRIYGNVDYLFFDEIQNAQGWPLFVNRLLRQGKHLLITGSNSKLLSHELSSHLTGRHHTIELFPFSFSDWCHFKGLDVTALSTLGKARLEVAFDEYLLQGGFPELLAVPDKKEYINALFHNILEQDIRRRFKVRNAPELVKMSNLMLNEAPALVVKEALKESCGIQSEHTVARYISYLTQTYLVSLVSKYSVKSRQRARNDKYYAIDVAFMDRRQDAFAGANLGWRLETMVYLELRRRHQHQDIFYYKEAATECDFVVCEGNRPMAAYQVCYDLSDSKTRTREVRGCKAALSKLHCPTVYLITLKQHEDISTPNGTIQVRQAWEWLLERE